TQGMGAYQFLGTPCSPRRSVEPYELPIGACTFEPLSPCALLSAAVLNPARPVWPSKLVDDQGPPGPERARARRRRLVLRGASSRQSTRRPPPQAHAVLRDARRSRRRVTELETRAAPTSVGLSEASRVLYAS